MPAARGPSISHFCREVGLNRQQFNRYINGQARPSAHNLLRIATAFGLDPTDFLSRPGEFRHRLGAGRPAPDPHNPLLDAFPGDLPALRRYLGFLPAYHLSLSWPGHIVCSCVHLREEADHVVVTTPERIEDAESGIRQRSRYSGWPPSVATASSSPSVRAAMRRPSGQTVLRVPFEVHQRLYLRGVTMGVSWRKDNQPYASRMIWRYHGHQTDRRALIERCGSYAASSGDLPSPVAAFLTRTSRPPDDRLMRSTVVLLALPASDSRKQGQPDKVMGARVAGCVRSRKSALPFAQSSTRAVWFGGKRVKLIRADGIGQFPHQPFIRAELASNRDLVRVS